MLNRFSRRAFVPAAAVVGGAQMRFLNIHEYSSKQLLQEFGCKTEFGVMATTLDQVKAACEQIKSSKKVVKSQILAGGRGKGTFTNGFKGGVHVCNGTEEALKVAKQMLGNTLVTKQTGEAGLLVSKLFITEAVPEIKRELYLALTLDRKTASPTFIGCTEGGVNIEDIAHSRPEMIKKLVVNIHAGISKDACKAFALELGFDQRGAELVAKQMVGIYNLAKAKDATMVEINPLVELVNGDVMCIDAKLSFDDNAQFRRPDVWALEDESQKEPKELEADKAGLNYVALDGNVGCLVNGAGLAMATMDIISLYGQKPANFLDVGGSAKSDQIVRAFEIITKDPKVKVILVNIFGGIMKCDVIAQGVIDAVKSFGGKLSVPLVVRLEGTNDVQGIKIIKESGLPIHAAKDLDDAGRIACSLVK